MSLAEALSSNDPWIAEKAQIASEVELALKNGSMSKDEAKEILQDLIDTDKLNESASDAKLKATLVFSVTQLIKLCG